MFESIRKRVSTALAVLVLLAAGASQAEAQAVRITLLHVSDTHSHLAAWGPKDASLDGTLGGLPRAAYLVAAEKAADPEALFVHAGDFMEGDLFFNEYLGAPEIRLLQSLGLDAMVAGNHEFRFGPAFLAQVFQAAWPVDAVPVLGTNLVIPADNELEPWVTPTLIKEAKGIKVGFFGLTPPDAAMSNPDPVVIRDDLATIAQAAVEALREDGARVVVCLSHNGMDAARELAGSVPGIDVIVNGHDNAVLEQPEAVERPGGGITLIVSAGCHYRWVGRLGLAVAGDQVGLADYALLGADAETPSDPATAGAVEELKAGIAARYGDVYHQALAEALRGVTMDWDPDKAKRDTPLGNLFTDAYRAWTGTDIALEPFGYMGDPLPEGPVTGADMFRAMSYGNLKTVSGIPISRPWRLATFRATGEALIGALEILLYYGGDYFPQVSGLRFQYDSRARFGHKVLTDTVEVGGAPLVAGQLYSFTATEQIYLALVYMLGMPVQDYVQSQTYAFDAVREYVSSRPKLGFTTSGRIRDIAAVGSPGREVGRELK